MDDVILVMILNQRKLLKTIKTMTTHIILALVFILSILIVIIFSIVDDNSRHDFSSLVIIFTLISVGSGFATIVQGFMYNDKIHYRSHHAPLIEDVNNGYAELIEYKTIKNSDTIVFYNIKWLGNNQDGEREININNEINK